MRSLLLATAAAAALAATPAVAKNGSPYVGIEGGILFPENQRLEGAITLDDTTNFPNVPLTNVGEVRFHDGYDVDGIAGYDFGVFRLEGELGYKHASVERVNVNNAFISAINVPSGNTLTSSDFDISSHANVFSAMVNGLIDIGPMEGFGLYAGGGAGYANIDEAGRSTGNFAWQAIAGVYTAVSDNVDVGIKYRYFNGGRVDRTAILDFTASTAGCGSLGTTPCTGGTAFVGTNARFRSHSLMLSLVYNFYSPPPPPPPPPPPRRLRRLRRLRRRRLARTGR